MAAVEEIKRIFVESGIEPTSVQFTSYRAAEGDVHAPITLTFVTYVAGTPPCGGDWSKNLAVDARNLPWPEFGCSTQHNFAAIVADPRDIVEPHTTDPADAQRRSYDIGDKYQKAMPTRTPDTGDSVRVSTAVQ